MAAHAHRLLQSLQSDYEKVTTENARLKQALHRAFNAVYYWKEQAIFYQSERDYYQERSP